MKTKSLINWRLFAVLLAAGVLATVCVLPYAFTLQANIIHGLPISRTTLVMVNLLQSSFLLAVAIFFGLWLGKKLGLGAPILEAWLSHRPALKKLKRIWPLSVGLGLLAGLLIIGFEQIFSRAIELPTGISPPAWQGFLASFYGGIAEEILLRLFVMTLFVRIFSGLKDAGVWLAILLSALLFGLGHLPATAAIMPITPLVIARAIVLNGIGGVIFGWLYWKKGLEAAMIAHFSADIILHVIFMF